MLDNEKGLTCTWEITNYSMLPHKAGEGLKSPLFAYDKRNGPQFWLTLFPKEENSEYEGFVLLFLLNTSEHATDQKFAFSVTLVATEPRSSITWSIEIYKSNAFRKFVKLSDIFEKKHLYLPQDTLTIRCHVLPIENPSKKQKMVNDDSFYASNFNRHCSVRSGLLTHQRSTTLHVRNIDEFKNSGGNAVFDLESAFSKAPSFRIHLDFSNIDCVRIEICQNNLNFKGLFVKCKMTVISAHKEYQHSKESTHLFQPSLFDLWHFPNFLITSNLTRDKYLYLDDILLLQCDFAYSCIGKHYVFETNLMPPTFKTKQDRCFSELVANVRSFYSSGKFCDVDVRAGDETFPVHKAVICAISPVFRAMFENDTKERASNVVEIEDVDPDTLRRMLAFMYSGVLKEDLSFENACLLFSAADKYDLGTLKRRCSILLVTTLSVTSVCDVLVLADAHQDDFLLTTVHNFICSHTNETFYSEHWKSFMDLNPKLSGEILLQMWMKRTQL